jgi:hypothetical protein
MRRLFIGCVCAVLLSAAGAIGQTATTWMGDEEIRNAFAGVTINGSYVDGVKFTESYGHDGRISYSDPRKAMNGHWSVVNQTFCTLYDDFPSGGCFKVARHSANCFEFYFLTASESEAARPNSGRPSWTARGWNVASPATCDEKPAV